MSNILDTDSNTDSNTINNIDLSNDENISTIVKKIYEDTINETYSENISDKSKKEFEYIEDLVETNNLNVNHLTISINTINKTLTEFNESLIIIMEQFEKHKHHSKKSISILEERINKLANIKNKHSSH
jgi:hypothetical protein